jgi:hypothetical protein
VSLSGWAILGALAAVLIGFVAYAYWNAMDNDADQLDIGKYEAPEFQLAQPKQRSEGTPPTSSHNSPAGTEAPSQTPAPEGPLITLVGSEHTTDAGVDLELPSGTPSLQDTTASSNPSAQSLLSQSTAISMPTDDCSSQIGCAYLPQQIPSQSDATNQNAPSCTGNNGEDSCAKKKTNEKSKDKPNRRPHSHKEGSR